MRRAATRTGLLAALLALSGALAAGSADPVEFDETELRRIFQLSPLPPAPPDPTNAYADNLHAARFGHRLFFEPGFSQDGAVSCATCHDPRKAFADGLPVARGIAEARRNTPSLLNVAHNRWFFWDGRADTLWSQAHHPLEDAREMGGSRQGLVQTLRDTPRLASTYRDLFGTLPAPKAAEEEIDRVVANVGKALAAYERKLIRGDSPFDTFVAGLRENDPARRAALSSPAQRGLKLFIGKANCRICHGGPTFSDQEFHDVRVPPRGGGPPNDPGRYAAIELLRMDPFSAAGVYSDDRDGAAARKLRFLVNRPENIGLFRTPTLRNVALTAPYMHEGQLATLDDVLRHYSTFENATPPGHHAAETILTPLELSPGELSDLRAFLESLTGREVDNEWFRAPAD